MIETVASVSTTGSATEPVSAASGSEASAFDIHQFERAYQTAEISGPSATQAGDLSDSATGFRQALESIRNLNGSLRSLGENSLAVSAGNETLTPGLMLDMTVKAQEFLFQSQLTATVANKTSDGITQLFRQQG